MDEQTDMWFGTDSNLVCKLFMSPGSVRKRVSPNKLQSVTSIILDLKVTQHPSSVLVAK